MTYLADPARGALDVDTEKSDTVNLSKNITGIYVGVAGNVRVLTLMGEDRTITGIAAGSVIPIQCKRVYSTSTTATSVLGLY